MSAIRPASENTDSFPVVLAKVATINAAAYGGMVAGVVGAIATIGVLFGRKNKTVVPQDEASE